MRALAIVHQADAGPGVFADEMRERGVQLDEWLLSERGTAPAVEIAEYDAILTFGGAMHADQEDRHPWLRFEKDFLAAMIDDRMPILAVCLGSQLLADAGGGSARRAARAGDRLAPRRGDRGGERGSGDRPDGAGIRGLPVAQLRGPAAGWRNAPRPQPGLRAGLSDRRGGLGDPVPRRGERRGCRAWTDDYRSDEDAVRLGIDPDALRAETEEKICGWNRLGRELCGRFIDVLR